MHFPLSSVKAKDSGNVKTKHVTYYNYNSQKSAVRCGQPGQMMFSDTKIANVHKVQLINTQCAITATATVLKVTKGPLIVLFCLSLSYYRNLINIQKNLLKIR